MSEHDVIVVGGGPAGLSCAAELAKARVNVAVLEKGVYPRPKPCAGWIAPGVFDQLGCPPEEYGESRVLQPIRRFRLAVLPGKPFDVNFGAVVGFGILRHEFDALLASRTPARLFENTLVRSLRREGPWWVLDERFRARTLVGAGGHFCPVARMERSAAAPAGLVLCQCAEFRLQRPGDCPVAGDTPELYFSPSGNGYGWCFRKGDWLNLGFGSVDTSHFRRQAADFFHFLAQYRGVRLEVRIQGHAYRLGTNPARPLNQGVLLIGDAAGVARPVSGEGIGPAMASGVLAAQAILHGNPNQAAIAHSAASMPWLPQPLLAMTVRQLLSHSSWFRHSFLERYFLHAA